MGKVGSAIGRALRVAVDTVLPPLCLSCRAIVAEPGSLCPACWQSISFLGQPLCACCGLPFEVEAEAGALCAACSTHPPHFRRARAVFVYDQASKGLILRFKHADRLEGAPAFGRWLARAGSELLADRPLIAPVPLHRWRLWSRRYNQAAVLALALGRAANLTVAPDLLVRRRATPAMGRMNRRERAANVKGVFSVAPGRAATLAGRPVLLVDDVFTTGATVGECAKVLVAAGATAVDVLTLGRVVR